MTPPTYTAPRWYAWLLTVAFGLELWQVLWLVWRVRSYHGHDAGFYLLLLFALTPMLVATGLGALLQWVWWRRNRTPAPGEISTPTVGFIVTLLPVAVSAVGWLVLFGGWQADFLH